MAVKWLQSAVYPPARPKLQPGLTQAEVDADYRRLERYVEEGYAANQKRPQGDGRDEKGVRRRSR